MKDQLQLNEISKKLLQLKNQQIENNDLEAKKQENDEIKQDNQVKEIEPSVVNESKKPLEKENKRPFFFNRNKKEGEKSVEAPKKNEVVQIVHRDRGIAVSRYFENMQASLNEINKKLDNFASKDEIGSIDSINFEKFYLNYLSDNINRINPVDAVNFLFNLSFKAGQLSTPLFNEFNRLFEKVYALSVDAQSLLRLDERIKTKPRKRMLIKKMYQQGDETLIPLSEIISPPAIKEKTEDDNKKSTLFECIQEMFTSLMSLCYDIKTDLLESERILEDKIKEINGDKEQVKPQPKSKSKKTQEVKQEDNKKEQEMAFTAENESSSEYTDILEEISQLKDELKSDIKAVLNIEVDDSDNNQDNLKINSDEEQS